MNVLIMRQLQERVKDDAAHVPQRIQYLRDELRKVLKQEAVILENLKLAEQTTTLASLYKPMVAGRYQCPHCALSSGPCALDEVAAEAGARCFRCPSCSQQFEFQVERRPARQRDDVLASGT